MQAKNCTHILFMKSFVFKTSFSISYSIPYYHNVSSTAIFLWLPVSINWLPQIKMVSQFWEIASIWSTLYICISIMKYKRKMTSQDSNFAILSYWYIYLIAFLKNVVLGFNIRNMSGHVLMSQFFPVHPVWQWHLYPPWRSWQEWAFTQGLPLHSSESSWQWAPPQPGGHRHL